MVCSLVYNISAEVLQQPGVQAALIAGAAAALNVSVADVTLVITYNETVCVTPAERRRRQLVDQQQPPSAEVVSGGGDAMWGWDGVGQGSLNAASTGTSLLRAGQRVAVAAPHSPPHPARALGGAAPANSTDHNGNATYVNVTIFTLQFVVTLPSVEVSATTAQGILACPDNFTATVLAVAGNQSAPLAAAAGVGGGVEVVTVNNYAVVVSPSSSPSPSTVPQQSSGRPPWVFGVVGGAAALALVGACCMGLAVAARRRRKRKTVEKEGVVTAGGGEAVVPVADTRHPSVTAL